MRLLKILMLVACSVSTGTAVAGRQFSSPLKIDKIKRFAQGSLSTIRADNARDGTTKNIECWVTRNANNDRVECSAHLDTRTVAQCDSTNRAFLPVVQMINTSSFISFTWNSSGRCTQISVDNGSYHLQ